MHAAMPGDSRAERPLRATAAAITAPCQTCGRSPALVVTFRTVIGLGLPYRLNTTKGRYCRACGTAAFRDANNRTLLLGWWGVFALFANIVVIVMNLAAYRRVRALGQPRQSTYVAPQHVRPIKHPEMR